MHDDNLLRLYKRVTFKMSVSLSGDHRDLQFVFYVHVCVCATLLRCTP